MTVSNAGLIGGTVGAPSPYPYSVQAQVCDATTPTPTCASSSLTTIQIYAAPTITVAPSTYCGPPTPDCWPHAIVNSSYAPANVVFTVSGGAGCCFLASGVSGLPDGMTLSYPCAPSCNLQGVPRFKGIYHVSVAGYDSLAVSTNTVSSDLIVDPNPAGPTIAGDPNISIAGAVGLKYDQYCYCLVVSGGGGNPFDLAVNPNGVYNWSVTPSPPPGVKVADSGGNLVILGTPTAASALTTYTVIAKDAESHISNTATFRFQVEAAPPTLAAMPSGWDVGRAYTMPDGVTPVKLTSTTGTAPIQWRASWQNCNGCRGTFGGALPPGLTLAVDGTISGTPTAAGTYVVAIDVTDNLGVLNTLGIQIAISDPTLTIVAPASAAKIGQPYSDSFAVKGGTHPYTLKLLSGMPPAGLTLDRFGNLGGSPTGPAGAAAPFTVQATDLAGSTATLTVNMTLGAATPAAAQAPASPSPSPSPSPTPTPAPATPPPSPTPTASSPRAGAAASPSPSPTLSPTPSPSAPPTPSPTPSAAASPTPSPTSTPAPVSTPSPSPAAASGARTAAPPAK
jgi:hypothetical protein